MYSFVTFNEILFGALRPWKAEETNERAWEQRYLALKRKAYQFQPNFKVSLPGNLNNFRKYYSVIIENEAIEYLNYFHGEMKMAAINEERLYLLKKSLKSNLNQIMSNTDSIISSRRYSLDLIITSQNLIPENLKLANYSYTLFLLKFQAIRIYKELRKAYNMDLEAGILTDEELMFKYFREGTETLKYIVEAEKVEGLYNVIIREKPRKALPFEDRAYDFRLKKKSVSSYEKIVSKPKLLSNIEQYLYENGIIDSNFIFKESSMGMSKIKFAALVHQMIKKKVFNGMLIPEKKKIDDLMIRNFINYRYQTDIGRQFRELRNDEEKLMEIVNGDFFIERLGS